MRSSVFSIAAAVGVTLVQADDSSYDQNAGCNKDQLLRWFHSDTGLFYNNDNSPYWWQGANMLTTLAKFGQLDAGVKAQVTPVIASIYNNAGANKPFAKRGLHLNNNKGFVRVTKRSDAGDSKLGKRVNDDAFYNSFYDDEGWWGLGFVAAWELTGTIDYLNMAIYIWNDLNAGWGKPSCGGIYWNKNADAPVNAIENELYIHLSAAIANNVGDNVKQTYLSAAKTAWDWFVNSGMINGQNLVNDGITSSCQNNGNPTYTYNQGVILSGAAALYKATGDASYLDTAGRIADAAIATLVTPSGILADQCDLDRTCSGDGQQFKGVFTRGLRDLYQARQTDSWKQFILHNAQSIWGNDTSVPNGACMNGNYWAGAYEEANASTQSSALDTLVAALAVSQ